MEKNNCNFDSKENLGHGIKGESNTAANNLKSGKNNTKNDMNNKTTNDKINKI